jgi:hypothetical protein
MTGQGSAGTRYRWPLQGGGIDVPIIFTDQLPQQSIGQVAASVSDVPPVATVATEGDGFAWGTVALLGGALGVGLGVGWLVMAGQGQLPGPGALSASWL